MANEQAKTKRGYRPPAPRINVVVTAEIIESAERRNSGHCMISDAVQAAMPEARFISTDLQSIRFTLPEKGLRYIYLTPRVAQEALVDFDLGVRTEPFTTQLRVSQIINSNPSKKRQIVPSTAELHSRHNDNGEVPEVIGGQSPPTASHADPPKKSRSGYGQRRAFGLRGFRQ